MLFIGQFTLKIVSFFSVRSLWQSLLLKIYHFNDKLSLLLEWPSLRQPFLVFFPLNFNNVFILEYIVRSDFVPVLKTFSGTPIYSIIGSSSILRMVDHCYPYNIWYLGFCGELSFSVLYPGSILPQKFTSDRRFLWIIGSSKQRLKWYSVLEIFVKNFLSVKTFVKHSSEAFVKHLRI